MRPHSAFRALLLGATFLAFGARADDGPADNGGLAPVASGQVITPTAATGAVFQPLNPGLTAYPAHRAAQAINTALSPDGATLLALTSGYNLVNGAGGNQDNAASNEYVFVYDVTGANKASPAVRQVIQVPNTFVGIAWSGTGFYVSGGKDDKVYYYAPGAGGYVLSATIGLGHAKQTIPPAVLGSLPPSIAGLLSALQGAVLLGGNGLEQSPVAAGLAVSPDGTRLVVANVMNDSVSVIDPRANTVLTQDYDLRPYNTSGAAATGTAGGETPFGVAITAANIAFVSSVRDREIVVLDVSGARPVFVKRIPLTGAPNTVRLVGTTLYATEDNADRLAVIDTAAQSLTAEYDTIAPAGTVNVGERYTGAAPNNVVVSPDGKTAYVTNGGANDVAAIDLASGAVKTLIPTGWYPHALSLSADGTQLYVVNGKSDPGQNPDNLVGGTNLLQTTTYPGGNDAAQANANASNEYILQTETAGLLSLPVPGPTDYASLTARVAANNGYSVAPNPSDTATMAALHKQVSHVIYIVKENRTFDQVLGDLANGSNADPALAVFGRTITPNFHRIASQFVTLDNFFDSGEVSGNGWEWSTQARETDFNTKAIPLNYSGRGMPYEAEGQNRLIDIGYPTAAARTAVLPLYPALASALKGGAANLLPGTNDDGATDGPNGARQTGYIWDSAVRAGLTVRNYGFFIDEIPYNIPGLGEAPVQNPYPATPQAVPLNPTLQTRTDAYFRGFDNVYPDVWREQEWEREFAGYTANGTCTLPNLELVRLMHDHMGNFGTALAGLTYPEAQQADNDLSVGKLLQRLANSPCASSTVVFVLEDDAQDGPDHMDAHRSTGYVAGAYVRRHAVVSTRYSTVNMLRTIEDILGIDHLNLNDAYQRPMADVFDPSPANAAWSYAAVASSLLRGTGLASAGDTRFADGDATPRHDATYWAEKTRGFDFSAEDRVPAGLFNRVLWEGLMDTPYPTTRSGVDLRTEP